MEKQTRGGKRLNSGRKKGIETTTMRVPLYLKEIIQRFILRKQLKKEEKL